MAARKTTENLIERSHALRATSQRLARDSMLLRAELDALEGLSRSVCNRALQLRTRMALQRTDAARMEAPPAPALASD